jgi:CheY-like chemotaxis protein
MKPILQVEDDLNDIFLLQHALKKAGAENPVQVVTDGQEAIDYLQGAGKFADRAQFPLPCLVLLDLNMPCVPGLDVLRWIRQQAGMSIAVLVLSTSGEESDIAAAYRMGANGFLIKPSQASKLAEMAKAIKDFWLTHATLPKEAPAAPAESVVASARANPFPDKQMLPGEWAALTSRTMAIK